MKYKIKLTNFIFTNKIVLFFITIHFFIIIYPARPISTNCHPFSKQIPCDTNFNQTDKFSNNNWIKYGPIRINSANYRIKGKTIIFQAINNNNQPFYLAINCINGMFNLTGSNLDWKGWFSPFDDFEKRLKADFCRKLNTSIKP